MPGPVAIVTGAARGTGAVAAVCLADNGMDVAVLDTDEAACAGTVNRIAALGRRCVAIGADVTDAGSVDAALSRVRTELGDPGVLLYAAGGATPGPLCGLSDREWEAVSTGPLRGAFLTSRAVLDPMVKNGEGRIVIVVAQATGHGSNHTVHAGLDGFARTLALELNPLGITVNLVVPRCSTPDPMAPKGSAVSMVSYDEQVARTVALLVSGSAAAMSGQVLYLDGAG